MRKTSNILLFLSLLIMISINSSYAIEIRHTDTVWAGQCACNAQFTLDNGGTDGEPVGNLEITVNVLDKNGKILQKDTLNVEPFGDSDATRYQTAYLEGENYCEDGLTINIVKTVQTIKGKKKNLPITTLTTSEFKPYTVLADGKNATQ